MPPHTLCTLAFDGSSDNIRGEVVLNEGARLNVGFIGSSDSDEHHPDL